ncbi:DNA cytosine methyltransferase [Streptomyces sp. S063]|uniref:DNA cytosine methyltransferase n=1 Tax=Streptomyces sp. S063 TaxID=2005885 RepID=UPI001F39E04F|nr:DNA cytosine methyltransferase [Streptomyces sp. S063]
MTLAPASTSLIPRVSVGEANGSAAKLEYAVAEFFAGIGLARLGLEGARCGFKVTWANDLEESKQSTYLGHFGQDEAKRYKVQNIKDVAKDIDAAGVPRNLDLAWASFPCTDLSLAGGREGLAGSASGTFWDLTDILGCLGSDKPRVVALENVNGFATSHGGEDIKAAVRKLNLLGYSVDVITLDARRWVPQSRPRLFLVASLEKPLRRDDARNTELRPKWLDTVLDAPGLVTHRALLPSPPPLLTEGWTDLVDGDSDDGVEWWDKERTAKFTAELSNIQKKRKGEIAVAGKTIYRTAYRRTRGGVPAWEIRADDIAGCLRTAGGGSSKQAVVRIRKNQPLKVRWMTAREYAKLMGAPDYTLPESRNQSIMGFGDAVCVDAVRWLAENYLEPLLSGRMLSPTEGCDAEPADETLREVVYA